MIHLKLLLTLQWVSWISSCWNMYAVIKQNNSDTSGKPTVARHSFRNDSARYMELLLLPTLFSSILAESLNILAFVRKINWHENSKSRSQSDNCAIQIHVALQSCRFIRWSINFHAVIFLRQKIADYQSSMSLNRSFSEIIRGSRSSLPEELASISSENTRSNCERGGTRLFYRYLQNLHDKSTQQARNSFASDLSRSNCSITA